jgi:hypothetical protein
MKPVIAIPAFQRARSLQRLLTAVARARIPEGVRVVLSLEGGASSDVQEVARRFRAEQLDVEILLREERLGLRRHLLACGDLALQGDGVIILEDDLTVDPYFYEYAAAALDWYAADERVGGIALYSPEYNEFAGVRFTPLRNGFSTYLMRTPCSSGQCWTAEQWGLFKAWYETTDSRAPSERMDLPSQVRSWPNSSWKRYFACYLVAQSKDIVFPYESYSTNCSDAGGTHIPDASDLHQVHLGYGDRLEPTFRFCPTDVPAVAYDAFMEPCGSQVYQALGLSPGSVELDLAGIKPAELFSSKPLVVTSKRVRDFDRSFGLNLRPVELNLNHPADSNLPGPLRLANREAVLEDARTTRTLTEYNYYSGLTIGSRPVLLAILRQLPHLVLRALYTRWKRL